MEHLKRYLQALGSFHALWEAVENVHDSQLPQPARKLDKAQRWTWFVSLAVERCEKLLYVTVSILTKDRFERWIQTLQVTTVETFIDKFLPPPDVLMVFHTYLLNPLSVHPLVSSRGQTSAATRPGYVVRRRLGPSSHSKAVAERAQ